MKCFLPNFPSEKAAELMSWFGYSLHREDDGSLSFARSPMAPEARFPRFHLSVFSKDDGLQVNIHLDQEDDSRQGNHQFVWAYHNPLVMEEGKRLLTLLDRARAVFLKENKSKSYAKFHSRTTAGQRPKFNASAWLWRAYRTRRPVELHSENLQ